MGNRNITFGANFLPLGTSLTRIRDTPRLWRGRKVPFRPPAVAAHPGECGNLACGETVVPTRQGISTRLWAAQIEQDTFKHAKRHDPGNTPMIPAGDAARGSHSRQALLGRPIDGCIGFRKMPRTGRNRLRIDFRQAGQHRAHPDPLEALIPIRRIKHRLDSGSDYDLREIVTAPAEQRAEQKAITVPRQRGNSTHGRKPANARTAREPHHQRFCLIVGMMCRCDRSQSMAHRPFAKRFITRLARPLLQGRARQQRDCQGFVRNAEVGTYSGNVARLICALRSQSVIDCRYSESTRKCGLRKKQQGKTVRPARHREANLSFLRPDR